MAGTGYRFGGQRNTPIPNYVYRWTRREVEKTVLAFAPVAKHRFFLFLRPACSLVPLADAHSADPRRRLPGSHSTSVVRNAASRG